MAKQTQKKLERDLQLVAKQFNENQPSTLVQFSKFMNPYTYYADCRDVCIVPPLQA